MSADMKTLLDTLRTARKEASENILLDVARDDEGNDFHVIRNVKAPSGKRVLYREPSDIQGASLKTAEARLTDLRDRYVILAILTEAGLPYAVRDE